MTEQQQPTTAEPELRDVRIGSTEHYTLSASNMETGAATLCGRLIAGTPVAPTTTDFCYDCQARLGCDECGHGVGTTDSHLWAPAFEAPSDSPRPDVARFVYDHSTCWAENICRICSPELYAQALELLGQAPAALELH